jgi:hypothetical protein
MTIDFLNSVSSNVKAAEAPDYKPHPLGEFHGIVQSVESKYVRQMSNSVIELKIATTDQSGARVGVANYNEWMFTDEDIARAQRSQEDLDKLKARIGRMKRLFVDLNVFEHDFVDAMPWSNTNPNEPGILESFDKLMGARCSVTVKANTKPNKPAMVFVNAPLETVVGVTGAAPEIQKKSATPMGQTPMGGYAPPHPQQPYNSAPIGGGLPQMPQQNLNGIPF